MRTEILRMEHIEKSLPGIRVLDDFRMNIYAGEILGLIGLSGSGKTMLANILSGLDWIDAGTFLLFEQPVHNLTWSQAQALGVYCIHQRKRLVPQLSVGENLYLFGNRPQRRALVKRTEIDRYATKYLEMVDLEVSPAVTAEQLTLAQQHLVELAKAIALNSRLIVVDDITSSYTARELEKFTQVLRQLKARGVSVLFESHQPDKILGIADRILVMRDGKNVKMLFREEFSRSVIVNFLLGKENHEEYQRSRETIAGEVVLQVQNAAGDPWLALRKGEILGLFDSDFGDVQGLVERLLGMQPAAAGRTLFQGQPLRANSLRQALNKGIGVISQDSIEYGLFPNLSIVDNLSLLVIRRIQGKSLALNPKIFHFLKKEHYPLLGLDVRQHGIRTENLDYYTKQKIILQRWVLFKPKVLVCVKPFTTADIVTRSIIFRFLEQLAQNGAGIIVLSSDLSEATALFDRIVILRGNTVVGAYDRHEFSRMNIFELY